LGSRASDEPPRSNTEDIRGVIRGHTAEVKQCYERERAAHPGLAGRIMMGFVIAPSGEVKYSTLQNSTMNNATVEDCIGRAICSWRFSPTKPGEAGTVFLISYPWVLNPK
jgi:hypothetical protein